MTDLDLMRGMTDSQRFLFQTEMLKHRKSVGVAAVLCFVGFLGLHRFYLGQIGLGLLYACTFGIFLVGALLDLLRIGTIVEGVNRAKAEEVAAQIRGLDTPLGAASTEDSGPPSLARRLGRWAGGRR